MVLVECKAQLPYTQQLTAVSKYTAMYTVCSKMFPLLLPDIKTDAI